MFNKVATVSAKSLWLNIKSENMWKKKQSKYNFQTKYFVTFNQAVILSNYAKCVWKNTKY